MNGYNGFLGMATDIRLMLRMISPDMESKTRRCLALMITFGCLFPVLVIAFIIVMVTVGGEIEFDRVWIPIVCFLITFLPTIFLFTFSAVRYTVCRQIMNFIMRIRSFDRVDISQLWISAPDGIILAKKLIDTGNLPGYSLQGSVLYKDGAESFLPSAFCPSCGSKVSFDDIFCRNCGKRLGE